jgi:hypothetical protein
MLKTVDFISNDLHFAKCVFGYFKRVEVADALGDKYAEDYDFVNLYLDIQKEEQTQVD